MPDCIILARYLFARLHQIGLRSLHGVPGDFNLTLLDHVKPAGLDWIGDCNELNAGYAADGYARIKSIGALVTTFGVGELSALNAIAGAYAEFAPVVHIVGTPSRVLQDAGTLMHHTLNDGNYHHFVRMQSPVTVAQADLVDPTTAAAQIDDALEQCMFHSRPVYISIPTDMVEAKLEASRLNIPLRCRRQQSIDTRVVDVVKLVLECLRRSQRPFILVDGESRSCGVREELNDFVCASHFPTATTAYGKCLIDESLSNYHGVYSGNLGKLRYKEVFDSADVVLWFGPHMSDTNTYAFTTIPDPAKTIMFRPRSVQIGEGLGTAEVQEVSMKDVLRELIDSIGDHPPCRWDSYPALGSPQTQLDMLKTVKDDDRFDQETFWQRLSTFFREGDIIMAETGTAGHGARDFLLPRDTTLIGPTTWLSIGYMLPAAQGAALAQREYLESQTGKGRTILFEGDGSFQMTAQAISTIIHNRLDMVIFLINNHGYTIERCIHGRKAFYNDVAEWNYLEAPRFFGAKEDSAYHTRTYQASTYGDLKAVLAQPGFRDGSGLRMVEILMAKEDCPDTLRHLGGLAEEDAVGLA